MENLNLFNGGFLEQSKKLDYDDTILYIENSIKLSEDIKESIENLVWNL